MAPWQFLSSHNPWKVDYTTGVRLLFAVVSSMMVREQLRAKFCGGRINWFVLIRTSPVHVQHILREKSKKVLINKFQALQVVMWLVRTKLSNLQCEIVSRNVDFCLCNTATLPVMIKLQLLPWLVRLKQFQHKFWLLCYTMYLLLKPSLPKPLQIIADMSYLTCDHSKRLHWNN